MTTATRTCSTCGGPLSAGSKYVHQCGRCAKSRLMRARLGTHTYTRTHVHEWADGRKTMEYGVRCGDQCPGWAENEAETGRRGTQEASVGVGSTDALNEPESGYSEGAA